jgi:hypothetical protein
MNRTIPLALLLVVIPWIMGATIVLDQAVSPAQYKLHEAGTYTLGANESLNSIEAHAKLGTQDTWNNADVNPIFLTWSKTLTVAPGTYECFGRIRYTPQGQGATFKDSNKKNCTVN